MRSEEDAAAAAAAAAATVLLLDGFPFLGDIFCFYLPSKREREMLDWLLGRDTNEKIHRQGSTVRKAER